MAFRPWSESETCLVNILFVWKENIPLDSVIFHKLNQYETFQLLWSCGCSNSFSYYSSHFLLPIRVILRRMWDWCQSTAFNVVIQQGNKEGNRSCMEERSHTYSTCLLWKCVYWSDCLTSSIPSRLCWQIILCNKGNENKASFSVQCFLEANQTPTGWAKRPSKAPGHQGPWTHQDLCSGPQSTGGAKGQVAQRRSVAFAGNTGNDLCTQQAQIKPAKKKQKTFHPLCIRIRKDKMLQKLL